MKLEPEFLSLRKRRRPLRSCHCEPLECRIVLSTVAETPLSIDVEANYETLLDADHSPGHHYPGGVVVTDTQIITETEIIPRFVAQPTIMSVRSGNWSDSGTWSLGRVPTGGDRVAIAENMAVVYTAVNDARIDGLEISGSLIFSPAVDTRLVVANLTVMPTGRLQIGTAGAPVASSVQAELVIADQPLDLQLDPRQYGTGLIALGKVTIHGWEIDQTWLRLDAEPRAGDRSLLLAQHVGGWQPGDHLVLPDTRQVRTTEELPFLVGQIAPHWEEVVIDRVEGNRIFLTNPLQYDHLGARSTSGGGVELLPHVALLNRNVIIRSENSGGTRGHTMFLARADVDIQFARFLDLGRTDALRPLDNTQFDGDGNVTHLGTNQIGRYAVHLHHMMGPENPDNVGYQFKFVGNTVERSRKWGVAVHDTSFGLIGRNVVYDAQGAGFATEDGSEIGNLFRDNITIRIQGTHFDGKWGTQEGDYGRGGSGFWFRRGGNLVVGNVAADSTYAGFVFDGYFTGTVVLPLFRGADKHEPGQGVTTELNPTTLVADNEAYGMTPHGLWAAFVAGNNELPNQPLTHITNLRLWNTSTDGVNAYHTARLTFDQLLILGDLAALDRNDAGTVGMDLRLYENFALVIRNSRIEGVRTGIIAPTRDATEPGIERPTVIENTTLKNYVNIVVLPTRDGGPPHGNVLEVRNVWFELESEIPDAPLAPDLVPPPANIRMAAGGENVHWTQPSIVRVYNYNRVPGDNFQVFYREQAPSYVLPQTDPALMGNREPGNIGSPQAGLTNAENWAAYGISMGGAVAPQDASESREEIAGLVATIQDLSLLAPRVVLVTPWNGAIVTGSNLVHVRYNLVGLLPPGARVYFQFDGGNPFTYLDDWTLFQVPPGPHSLRAYVGDSDGNLLSGTSVVTTWFLMVSS